MNALDAIVSYRAGINGVLDGDAGMQPVSTGMKSGTGQRGGSGFGAISPVVGGPASSIYTQAVTQAELTDLVKRAVAGEYDANQKLREKAALGDPAAARALNTIAATAPRASSGGGGGGGKGNGQPKAPGGGGGRGGGGGSRSSGPRPPINASPNRWDSSKNNWQDPTGHENQSRGNSTPLTGSASGNPWNDPTGEAAAKKVRQDSEDAAKKNNGSGNQPDDSPQKSLEDLLKPGDTPAQEYQKKYFGPAIGVRNVPVG